MFAYTRLLEEAGGPNAELSWLLYVVLGFFALMVLVGWLASRFGWNRKPEAPAAKSEPHGDSHGH